MHWTRGTFVYKKVRHPLIEHICLIRGSDCLAISHAHMEAHAETPISFVKPGKLLVSLLKDQRCMPRDSIACIAQRRQGMALNNMFCHINQLFEFQSSTFNSTNVVSSAAYDIHIIKWYLALISSNICYHPWYA